jgi:LuxR family maltose regulon positive regulatory protein
MVRSRGRSRATSHDRTDNATLDANWSRPTVDARGFATRVELLERLTIVPGGRCVGVVAPAGYGKSVLLSQWAEHDDRPAVTISLDRTHNDPLVLMDALVDAFGAGDAPVRDVARIAGLYETVPGPTLVLVDQLDALHARSAKDIIAALVAGITPRVTIGFATRSHPPIPTGTLYAAGIYSEIGADELSLDRSEAQALLDGLGGAADELDEVMRGTEGWPVGVYLALVAQGRTARPVDRSVDSYRRDVAEYLDDEVMRHLSAGRLDFLLRTSILDRMTGSLCDHVLETAGSHNTLKRLARSNLLVEPVDSASMWYRYNGLFREHLRGELARRDLDAIPGLHSRAASWYRRHGRPDLAIHHAQEAGDVSLAAALVAEHARKAYLTGRAETALEWLSWFEDRALVPEIPGLALSGALAHAIAGNRADAERWAAAMLDHGEPTDGLASLVRALSRPTDLESMRNDARRALDAAPADSQWHTAALATSGLARLLDGDQDGAITCFDSASVHGDRFSAIGGATFARAFHAGYLLDTDDWREAHGLITAAIADIDGTSLQRFVPGAVAFPVAARCAVRSGDADAGRRFMERASAARPSLSTAMPVVSCVALVAAAKAYLELGDVVGARQVASEAHDMLVGRGDFGTLTADLALLADQLRALPSGEVGASSLTGAELRLLPHLATHLTFPEIGDRLYISRHTVKTQAMSIYRKLDASSRSEAVDRARSLGILPG